MKRSAALIVAGLLLATMGIASPTAAEAKPGKGQQPLLEFPVLADVHINSGNKTAENLARSIDLAESLTTNLDAFVVVGDLTDNGTRAEEQKFMDIVNRELDPEAERLFTIGNHETYNGLSRAASDAQFLEITGMESLDVHKVVNGYHLIGLDYRVDAESVEWLKGELAAAVADDKNAPIFVFFHYPLRDTVYGSQAWGMDNEALYNLLARYPQVITFSGHSHYALEDPRSIMQDKFTAVNTGIGLNYLELDRGMLQGNIPAGAGDLAQNLLVRVFPNRVEIQRLDIHTLKPAGDPWIIKQPAKTKKFTYTADRDKKAPTWPADPQVAASATGQRTAQVSFNQAGDNLLVHHYEMAAVNVATGEVEATATAFSEYYYDPVPAGLTFDLGGLNPGTTYRIDVTAIDSFDNRSGPVSAEVTTDAVELSGITVTPSAVAPGDSGSVEVAVRNWGTVEASGTVRLAVDGPATVRDAELPFTVAAGETITLTTPIAATGTGPATATITATAEAEGKELGPITTKVFLNQQFGETFDGVDLRESVDEQIPFLGWTPVPPTGWTVTNASTMPQGTAEWQGWTFATPEFWVAADNQDRDKFTLGSGVIAVADPDEWDDHGVGASAGRFDSTLATPEIPVTGGSTRTLAFDSHYQQENPQRASVVAVYSDGSRQELLNYGGNSTDDNRAGTPGTGPSRSN